MPFERGKICFYISDGHIYHNKQVKMISHNRRSGEILIEVMESGNRCLARTWELKDKRADSVKAMG